MTSEGRKDTCLRRWVGTETPWIQAVMLSGRFATDELCRAALPCLQAVTSETLKMYGFEKRDTPVAAAQTFGGDNYKGGP